MLALSNCQCDNKKVENKYILGVTENQKEKRIIEYGAEGATDCFEISPKSISTKE